MTFAGMLVVFVKCIPFIIENLKIGTFLGIRLRPLLKKYIFCWFSYDFKDLTWRFLTWPSTHCKISAMLCVKLEYFWAPPLKVPHFKTLFWKILQVKIKKESRWFVQNIIKNNLSAPDFAQKWSWVKKKVIENWVKIGVKNFYY